MKRTSFTKAQRNQFLRDADTGAAIQCSHEGCTRSAQHIHHKVMVCEGGTDAPENLEMLCQEHHVELHSERSDFSRWGQMGGKAVSATGKNLRNLKQFRGEQGAQKWEAFMSGRLGVQ